MLRVQAHRFQFVSIICVIAWWNSVADAADSRPSDAVELALKQSQIADRFRHLETLLLKMAEYDANTNPRRSALLRQALARGKERQVGLQLNELVKLFQNEQLQKAVEGQNSVQSDLKILLDLLLSENRPDRLKSEQARVRDYIKQLDRIIRQQKSIQGRTEGGDDEGRLAKDQQQVAERTKKLTGQIDESEGIPESAADSEKNKDTDSQGDNPGAGNKAKGHRTKSNSESEAESDSESAENSKFEDGKADSGSESEKSGKEMKGESGKSADSKSGDSSEGPQGEGQQSRGQSGHPGQSVDQQQQQDRQFPGRKRIAAAEDRMRQAQEQLKKAQRGNAIEQQEEAKLLLERAKAELEEILRQLREEEIERVLAMLEGRFRRMLEMEIKIQDGTTRLSGTPAAKRTRQFTIKTGKLSLDQRKIVLEVDKALTLLREEGSSVAFPEAVSQMRADMELVAKRLAEEKVGSFTQGIEADITTALEEMIAALQMAQQEAEERRNQPPQQQQQSANLAGQPLVNTIAELKMVRALQMRVNTRTLRHSKSLADVEDPVGQAVEKDLVESLRELSSREKRIYKVTSDIVLGKNK